MQYRMRGKVYDLGNSISDSHELGRIQWLAKNASYNPNLQQSARVLLRKGTHIHLPEGEYVVIDDFYNVEEINVFLANQMDEDEEDAIRQSLMSRPEMRLMGGL